MREPPLPLRTKARLAQIGIGAVAAVYVLIGAWQLFGVVSMSGLVPFARWELYDGVSAGFALLLIVTFIVSATFFIQWQRRLHRNNHRYNGSIGEPEGVGSATWGWFIPIVSLWVPYANLRDAARPAATEGSRTLGLIGLWWTCWLCGHFAGWTSSIVGTVKEDPTGFVISKAIGFCQVSLMLLAGFCAILTIRRVSADQRRRLAA